MLLCPLSSLLALSLAVPSSVQDEPVLTGFETLAEDPYLAGAFEELKVTPGPPTRVLHQIVKGSKDGASFVNLVHRADARAFRGQLISLQLPVRLDSPSLDTTARLWVRVLRADGTVAFEDDGVDVASRSVEWTTLRSEGAVAEDATDLYYGLVVQGTTQVRMRAFELELLGAASSGDPRHAVPDRWVRGPDVRSVSLTDPERGGELRVTSFIPAGHATDDLPHLLLSSDGCDLRKSYTTGRALMEAMRLTLDPPAIVSFIQPEGREQEREGLLSKVLAQQPIFEWIEEAMPELSGSATRILIASEGPSLPAVVQAIIEGARPAAEADEVARALEGSHSAEGQLHAERVLLRWMSARNSAGGDAELEELLFDVSLETLEP